MMLVVLLGIVILTSASVASGEKPLSGDSKKAIPLSGEEPYAALQRGDFRVAAALFTPIAEKGDVRAQYNLGLLYASGLGVGHDYQAALKWHRLAAGQGHAGAQNALAQMYAKGHGIPQDNVRAHMWYSVAVESSTAGSKRRTDEGSRQSGLAHDSSSDPESRGAGQAVPGIEVEEMRREVGSPQPHLPKIPHSAEDAVTAKFRSLFPTLCPS
ncbi:MAG: sel1 repeat family protein [Nitrospira sp.]|nr:sel1 repeat family protein [Nitrospira sp.]